MLPASQPEAARPSPQGRVGRQVTRWLVSQPTTALTAEPIADGRRRPSGKSVLFKVSPGQPHPVRPQMVFKTIIVSKS